MLRVEAVEWDIIGAVFCFSLTSVLLLLLLLGAGLPRQLQAAAGG